MREEFCFGAEQRLLGASLLGDKNGHTAGMRVNSGEEGLTRPGDN